MDGVQLLVLPEGQSELASTGVGELFIGGRGLARGYLKRPDLDSQRFVIWDRERYYATGDLAEVDGRGVTTIIGRNDSMVKIRGYSVYLSAIEETLRKHCGAADAAVLAESKDESNRRLVAYVVRGPRAAWKVDGKSGTSRDLRALLERYLPLYMVPSHFMELETLPINQQTGKLERKALPALRESRHAVKQRTPLSKCATAGERLRALRELWSEALEVDGDSLEDDWNFFQLGGHSLTGLDLTLGIEQLFGIELSGTEIYEYPTINELGAYLEHRGPNMESRISLAEDSTLDPAISPSRRPENYTSQRGVLGPCDGNNRIPGSLFARRTAARHGTGHPVLLPGKGPGLRTGRVHQPRAGHPEILRAGRPVIRTTDRSGGWRPHPAPDGSER